jgi:hypothetical protein
MAISTIPESKTTHGKIAELSHGLSLSNTTISSSLEVGVSVTLLFNDGSTIGPTNDSQIIVPSLPVNTQLTGVIIAGLSYLQGQWEVASPYSVDNNSKLALRGEKVKVEGGEAEKGNLILELNRIENTTRHLFLHRVAKADFVDDDGKQQRGSVEQLLASIIDRDERKLALRINNSLIGASISFGPVTIKLDFDFETSRVTGKIEVLSLEVASVSMGLNEQTEITLPDIFPFRRFRLLLWTSPISVDVEIFYEQWNVSKLKWQKKHRERGVLIQF